MTSIGENEQDPGANNAGAAVGIFILTAAAQQNSGVTVSVDLAAAKASKGLSCWEFTVGAGNTYSVIGSEQKEDTSADAGALTIGSLSSAEHLWVRAIASETTNAAIGTQTTSYTVFTSTQATTGTEATSMGIAAEFRIVTATTETSNPTMSDTSADRASSMIALDEVSAASRRMIVTQ